MEIIKNNNSPRMAITATVALAGGVALLGLSLFFLPHAPAYGFPWAFTGAVAALLPISLGGWCLGGLVGGKHDENGRYGHEGHGGGIVFALGVIVAGVLLLGFNSGLLPVAWKRVFFSWQMLLLFISMAEFARGRFIGAAVLLAVGGFFVLRRLAAIYPDIASSGIGVAFWPVLLIIAGIVILGGIVLKPRHGGWCGGCRNHHNPKKWQAGNSKASGVIDITTVFGGSEQVYLDPEFRGGKISAIFGGVKLDLRRTGLPEGITWLVVESVFGGVEIDAPEEWNIEVRNESIFGGFADKRLPAVGPGYSDGRKLIIRASNVFGGGEIK